MLSEECLESLSHCFHLSPSDSTVFGQAVVPVESEVQLREVLLHFV